LHLLVISELTREVTVERYPNRLPHVIPKAKKAALDVLPAVLLYFAFAVYLFHPYFGRFGRYDFLLPVNLTLAATGCFVLSRRWVLSAPASFFAGALYGFGPLLLYLAGFHPSASFLAAAVPWLFAPAAFIPRRKGFRYVSWLLATLPFAAIILFFVLASRHRLFAVPLHVRLGLFDLTGLLAPLVTAERGSGVLLGFYHVPVAFLVMGIAMLIAARRFGIVIIFIAASIPAFCPPLFNVSPVIWLSIPALCCAVIIAAGFQAFLSAGRADGKWLLFVTIVMAALSIISLLLATECFQVFAGLADKYARLLTFTGKMYILAAVTAVLSLLTAYYRLRIHWVRAVLLCAAAGIDVFLGARFILDRVI